MRASVIIPTFSRDELLDRCLARIRQQRVDPLEIIVVNDGPDSTTTYDICREHYATYILSGRHEFKWRMPGFAFNIGVRAAKADIVILTEPEIYQIDDCIEPMIAEVEKDNSAYVVPADAKKDSYNKWNGNNWNDLNSPWEQINAELTGFLCAFWKQWFLDIGGFDEDFVGRSYDDVDCYERLLAYGLHTVRLPLKCIHLYHDRKQAGHMDMESNDTIYQQKKGTIFRNGAEPKHSLFRSN